MKIFRNLSCVVTNSGLPVIQGVRPQEQDLGIIRDGAIAWSKSKGIIWVGPDKQLPKIFRGRNWRHVSCKGLTAYPGLVDPHTHLAFAGDRSHEFELRMRGAKYQEIAAAGGGILHTMRETRKISANGLQLLVEERVRTAKKFGVRLLEAKSGYGLDPASEEKSLMALKRARTSGVELVRTCLSAHAIPPEYKENAEEYVHLVTKKILPSVKRKSLAEFVDVFCDPGFFTLEQAREILTAAKALGFSLRVHGEELANTGVAQLAAELGAHSVDHLLKVNDDGIRALAKSETVGILLPATSFYLREAPAPARKLIDAGVRVALATDFNPGTSPTQNLPFIGTLAAVQLGMSTAEIIAALTWNGAKSLGRENSYGALLPGFKGEPVFCEGDHPAALFYRIAPAALLSP